MKYIKRYLFFVSLIMVLFACKRDKDDNELKDEAVNLFFSYTIDTVGYNKSNYEGESRITLYSDSEMKTPISVIEPWIPVAKGSIIFFEQYKGDSMIVKIECYNDKIHLNYTLSAPDRSFDIKKVSSVIHKYRVK